MDKLQQNLSRLSLLAILCVLGAPAGAQTSASNDTCRGSYPDYLDLPDGSNSPPAGWTGPVFRLSQAFPAKSVTPDARPWRKFNPFTAENAEQRSKQALGYIGAVYDYILEGNVKGGDPNNDFALCDNPVRPWFHVPWMHFDQLKGREFVHGMTKELTAAVGKFDPAQKNREQAWAVGFYNAPGAHTIGQVFPPGGPDAGTSDIRFAEGTVVGKVLMTTASPAEVRFLEGSPEWLANIHASVECAKDRRSPDCARKVRTMRFVQFDVAVVDGRSPYGWVFGTFIYNAAVNSAQPWRRVAPVGLMWGNDPGVRPEFVDGKRIEPSDPKELSQSVLFIDRLPQFFHTKDLGCAGRLDGPVDNPSSSCMSCHMTASIPKPGEKMPPIMDFKNQCQEGKAGERADKIYFRNIPGGQRFDEKFAAADYSLQVSDALKQYLDSLLHRDRLRAVTAGADEPEPPTSPPRR